MLAHLGAKVVLNDINKKRVEAVLQEVKAAAGEAIGVACSAEEGERIIQAAVQAYSTVHVVINNAGDLVDRSFGAMTEQGWDQVMHTHLYGSYAVCKAAWPLFRKQKYGRIINVSSTSGLHGNFGQGNYAAAKTALIGLTRTLALEGAKSNIQVNALVPTAWSNMTASLWPERMKEIFDPNWVAPVVVFLVSEECEETGSIIEAAAGWATKLVWQRSGGYAVRLGRTKW
jgi:multifunctional beta-oxidation protein